MIDLSGRIQTLSLTQPVVTDFGDDYADWVIAHRDSMTAVVNGLRNPMSGNWINLIGANVYWGRDGVTNGTATSQTPSRISAHAQWFHKILAHIVSEQVVSDQKSPKKSDGWQITGLDSEFHPMVIKHIETGRTIRYENDEVQYSHSHNEKLEIPNNTAYRDQLIRHFKLVVAELAEQKKLDTASESAPPATAEWTYTDCGIAGETVNHKDGSELWLKGNHLRGGFEGVGINVHVSADTGRALLSVFRIIKAACLVRSQP